MDNLEPTQAMPAVHLGPFRLTVPLGRGGMASVFGAEHVADGSPVAVKVLRLDGGKVPTERIDAFAAEVAAIAALDHPRITRVFDFGVISEAVDRQSEGLLEAGAPYLVMELVDGGEATKYAGRLEWPELRGLLLETLDALAHAHARGLTHRDIKPGNILYDPRTRTTKLTDFGLAATAEELNSMAERLEGSIPYMAPEQVLAKGREMGPATDLYAIGCTGWRLSAGAPVFSGGVAQVLASHLRFAPPPLEPQLPVSPDFEEWLNWLLEKDPAKRPPSAAAAAWGLVQCRDPEGDAPRELPSEASGLRTLFFSGDLPSFVSRLARRAAQRSPARPAPDPTFRSPAPPPPLPPQWRGPRDDAPRPLHGAGLGLVGKRVPGLVGRDAECASLWAEVLTVQRTRSARMVLIEGAAGCGKSALADRVAERAAELGAAQVLRVGHRKHHGAQDGLGQTLRRHHRLQGLSPGAARERLSHQLATLGVDDPAEVDRLGAALLPMSDDDRVESTVSITGPLERYALTAGHLARIAGEGLVVLRVDDLAWGHDTVDFLHALLDGPEALPILVLATLQTENAARSLLAGSLDSLRPRCATMELGELDRESIERLLRDLVGLSPALAHQVARRSDGNPLFAIELVRGWAEQDLLGVGPDGYRLLDGGEGSAPAGLVSLWEARVEHLVGDSPEDAQALELAAAICQDVVSAYWRRCCAAAGLTPSPQLVPGLLRRGLLTTREGALGFSFAHPMVREALLRRAEAGGRRPGHHGLIADVIGGELPSRELARQLTEAGRASQAVPVLLDAARRLVLRGEVGAVAELLEMLGDALDALKAPPDHPDRLRHRLLGASLTRRAGDAAGAYAVCGEVLAEARQRGEPDLLANALGALAVADASAGRYAEAAPRLTEAIELAREHGLRDVSAWLLRIQGYNQLRAGDVAAAAGSFTEALDAAEDIGDPEAMGRCSLFLARVALARGDRAAAGFQLQEAKRRFARRGHRWGLAEVAAVRGDLHRAEGELEAAQELYTEAKRRFSALGAVDGNFVDLGVAMVHLEQGHAAAAADLLTELLQRTTRASQADLAATARLMLLAASAEAGRWADWDERLERTRAGLASTGAAHRDLVAAARRGAKACRRAGHDERADGLRALAKQLRRRLRLGSSSPPA